MKCKQQVERGSSMVSGISHYSQCNRKALPNSDYCWQHQPEAIKEREEQSAEIRELHRINRLRGFRK